MYISSKIWRHPCSFASIRSLTSAEVATALRPFYFSVHPDLFGKYPEQRKVNENSMKQLSAYLATFHTPSHAPLPKTLPFYVRTKTNRGSFTLVNILIKPNQDPYEALTGILKACNLPTDYVEKMPRSKAKQPKKNPVPNPVDPIQTEDIFTHMDFERQTVKAKEAENLKLWLTKHSEIAKKRRIALSELKEEVHKLQNTLKSELGLSELRWECGWNVEHYRGCLKSLQGLKQLHPNSLDVLEGRILVFAPFTGVSLDGHVMLNSGEVRNNWLDLIKNVNTHEKTLKQIPAYEQALSNVLRNISVGRRKFMPKVLASEYAAHLSRITTSLLDYLSRRKYPKEWPNSLSEYEIVVECEAGPMMVTPTGQMIAPSSCPGPLLVDFITDNLQLAKQKLQDWQTNKHKERSLCSQCIQAFHLESLSKDDSIFPEHMIECLDRLIRIERNVLQELLQDASLHITNYYSVLGDGTICIPWNWKLH